MRTAPTAKRAETARRIGFPVKGYCVKVRKGFNVGTTLRRLVLIIPIALALTFVVYTPSASAITRSAVIKRANHWVVKKVPYSQRGYFQGYRRDCSGFVSMAWKLKTSYTSRSIGAVAKRISKSKMRPGDAVHTPGHVAIFGGWANKSRTRYVAYEESGRGKPALKRVRNWRSSAKGLRYRGIKENPVVAKAVVPAPPNVRYAAALIPATTPASLPVSAPFV